MKKFTILFFSVFLFFMLVSSVSAVCVINGRNVEGYTQSECETRGGRWTADPAPGGGSINNPIAAQSFQELFGFIIKGVLGLVGSIALVMFIFGGFTWMTAAGNAEKIQKGKDVLIWATLGLIIIFSAYAVLNYIFVTLNIT